MREPITKIEKEDVDKFESIVAEEVDKLDPIGLLKIDCPKDEYAQEIRAITLRLWMAKKNWLKLSEIMYVVFAYKFDLDQAKPESKYLVAAQNIVNRCGEIA